MANLFQHYQWLQNFLQQFQKLRILRKLVLMLEQQYPCIHTSGVFPGINNSATFININ